MNTRTNYMLQEFAELEAAIKEVIGKTWKIIEFRYDEKDCHPHKREDGEGIICHLINNNDGVKFHCWYPLKDYATLESFIDSLNCDAALMNIQHKYPQLCIRGESFSANTLTIVHPADIAKPKDKRYYDIPKLSECYDKETGEFDSHKYIQIANAWLAEEEKNPSALKSVSMFRGGAAATEIKKELSTPKKVSPPFFLEKKKPQPQLSS